MVLITRLRGPPPNESGHYSSRGLIVLCDA